MRRLLNQQGTFVLNCYNVPLHLWNVGTFFSIGRVPGDVIALDEGTSSFFSFNVGKVLISTSNFEVINQMINLEVNGKLYPVRVVKEQVNSFMQSVCTGKCREVKPEQFNGKDSDEEDDDMDNEVDELAEPTQEIIQPIG